MATVGVVILTYNDVVHTMECLESLVRSDYKDLRIIVVDNGSLPELRHQLAASLKGLSMVEFLQLERNYGFASAINRGIQRLLENPVKYIVVLNNDTVVAPDAIGKMVLAAQHEVSVAIVCPKILYYEQPEVIWYAGSVAGVPYARHRGLGKQDRGQFNQAEDVPFATGCAMLLKRAAVEQAGMFDERYFFGMEDRELSIRYRAHGCRIKYLPSAIVYHKVGRSRWNLPPPERVYLGYLSQLFFIRQTRPGLVWVAWYLLYALYFTLALPWRLGVGRLSRWLAAWKAWWHAWRANRAWPPWVAGDV